METTINKENNDVNTKNVLEGKQYIVVKLGTELVG